jgi:fibronectin type 3 domain-containing protein
VVTLSNVASTGKIKISWKAITGAVKYEVYRSIDNENWTLLKTTTGTSLTNTSTTAGELYYYKVKAIASNSGANSAYSSVKSRTCDLARPTLTVSLNSKDKPVLSWTKVTGAVKYEVYRSTDGESWTLLKTTTSTKLTNSSATSGTTYYYKVRAIASSSSANSAYSTVKSVKAG